MEHKYIEEGRAISKGLAAVGDGKYVSNFIKEKWLMMYQQLWNL